MYKIISCSTTKQLEELVNLNLKQGFVPIGGVTFDGKNYIQSIFKNDR